jgi:hypothetical protein
LANITIGKGDQLIWPYNILRLNIEFSYFLSGNSFRIAFFSVAPMSDRNFKCGVLSGAIVAIVGLNNLGGILTFSTHTLQSKERVLDNKLEIDIMQVLEQENSFVPSFVHHDVVMAVQKGITAQ